ncbi:MAG TPA: hypothetical protein PK867_06145 [Pirellulales bacterium]|nr:hypothetical protein [Pirellulales bacterium]
MMTALRISHLGRRSAEPLRALRTSTYECVASWLLACLLLVGAVTFCLLVVWLGMRGSFSFIKSVPVNPMQVDRGGESDLGDELLLASPVASDLAAETDLTDPEFQSTLTTVIDARRPYMRLLSATLHRSTRQRTAAAGNVAGARRPGRATAAANRASLRTCAGRSTLAARTPSILTLASSTASVSNSRRSACPDQAN